MTRLRSQAKTLVLKWFDQSGHDPALRGRLSAGVDRFLAEILVRDSWSECMTVLIGDANAPHILASAPTWRATPCAKGLAVSTVVPGWGFGWHSHLRDEFVYDTLSWFGHYARQYIHRSLLAKVLMMAWEKDETILHPFGSEIFCGRYGPMLPPVPAKAALDAAVSQSKVTWGAVSSPPSPSRSAWKRRNTLDPAIHQAIFHFLRGQNLRQSGFSSEALVAFDCVIQSLQTLNWDRTAGNPLRSREDFCAALDFTARTRALAEHIYFLRNQFIAHAGGWRWWDLGECVDDELMDMAASFALRALRRAADLEPSIRTIDPAPEKWSDWLLSHFSSLWDAVWFR